MRPAEVKPKVYETKKTSRLLISAVLYVDAISVTTYLVMNLITVNHFSHILNISFSYNVSKVRISLFDHLKSSTRVQAPLSQHYASPHKSFARWDVKMLLLKTPQGRFEPHHLKLRICVSVWRMVSVTLGHSVFCATTFFLKHICSWKSNFTDVGSQLSTSGVTCIIANRSPIQPLKAQLSYCGF